MRIYRNLAEAVVSCLQNIFTERQLADKVIERTLRSNSKWGARDRSFIAETTYDIVRNFKFLCDCLGMKPKDIEDYYVMFGLHFRMRDIELPDWNEFKDVDWDKIIKRRTRLMEIPATKYSIPNWLYELGDKELGTEWISYLKALHKTAPLIVRINTLKIRMADFLNGLEEAEIEAVALTEEAVLLKKRINVFQTAAFKNGLFEVQDVNSQAISLYLDVQPGMRVIDACAGGGGKSLHIAALMQNKGRIISMDVEDWKLQELRKRARRNGVAIIEPKLIESSKTIKRLYNTADRVLLDVPCTGLGLLRRNPDTKWKLTMESYTKVKETQYHILSQYSKMVKIGGIIVYSTCSILPSENEEQVQLFLRENENYKLISEQRLLPGNNEGDGFYMAKIERKS